MTEAPGTLDPLAISKKKWRNLAQRKTSPGSWRNADTVFTSAFILTSRGWVRVGGEALGVPSFAQMAIDSGGRRSFSFTYVHFSYPGR